MDYEKKYKEALEKAKESMKDGGISQNTIDYLQNIFPELVEQMDALETSVSYYQSTALESLYNDLKRVKEGGER